jgi:hypothetical protein
MGEPQRFQECHDPSPRRGHPSASDAKAAPGRAVKLKLEWKIEIRQEKDQRRFRIKARPREMFRSAISPGPAGAK